MNDQLLKQLVRQMKIMNIWLALFGTLILGAIVAIGVILFMVIGAISQVVTKFETTKSDISSSVNVQEQACKDESSLTKFLKSAGVCK